ncbi:omega-hydroxypalmitate O-feruloyl transferase [Olea europaea subsp. europaea]|uniref:Omega-hydroxypalmitate O-feruloyl transferase n=1 Tax=Olea europaea subsp. europaea TaxID=158383 RepID=A0A8S0P9X3_OLEEU|nr:omega-hydroxypalmitate O-feruloyl transferase [Olea europaea subsp. europaea]
MGTLCREPLDPSIQDLKVTLQDSTLVFPSQETENRSIFLSNIDQVLNFYVQTIHFFPANPDFTPEVIASRLKTALEKVLVPYDFVAGRLKHNPQSSRLEVECNAAGAGFVVASTQFSLDEIGDLVYPNPAFRGLIVQSLDNLEADNQPLCIFQVTSFKCGGFAMGISTNHVLFDGISFKCFLENLASQAFDDKPLAIVPCHDRHLLAARSPPRVTFPHPELLKLELPIGEDTIPSVFDCQQEDLDFKIFHLNSDNISYLKEKAKIDGPNENTKITSFNVVSALIWRCKALSSGDNSQRVSTVLYAVDIRSRIKPSLPFSYCGNAVLSAYASSICSKLEDEPFSKIVDMVSEGAARMTDEYARSAIDWGEIYKGFPNGEFLISSWWKLGFSEVEYPWGKPRYSCPVVYHRKEIILLFPEINNGSNNNNGNGVNVLVALPAKEMEKFQSLFHTFLASN